MKITYRPWPILAVALIVLPMGAFAEQDNTIVIPALKYRFSTPALGNENNPGFATQLPSGLNPPATRNDSIVLPPSTSSDTRVENQRQPAIARDRQPAQIQQDQTTRNQGSDLIHGFNPPALGNNMDAQLPDTTLNAPGRTDAFPGPATNAFPSPATNAFPSTATNAFPSPGTNSFPSPATNAFPSPATNAVPGPATNAVPLPPVNPSPGTAPNTPGGVTPAPRPNPSTPPSAQPGSSGMRRMGLSPDEANFVRPFSLAFTSAGKSPMQLALAPANRSGNLGSPPSTTGSTPRSFGQTPTLPPSSPPSLGQTPSVEPLKPNLETPILPEPIQPNLETPTLPPPSAPNLETPTLPPLTAPDLTPPSLPPTETPRLGNPPSTLPER